MEKLNFLFGIELGQKVPNAVYNLSKTLQGSDISATEGKSLLKMTQFTSIHLIRWMGSTMGQTVRIPGSGHPGSLTISSHHEGRWVKQHFANPGSLIGALRPEATWLTPTTWTRKWTGLAIWATVPTPITSEWDCHHHHIWTCSCLPPEICIQPYSWSLLCSSLLLDSCLTPALPPRSHLAPTLPDPCLSSGSCPSCPPRNTPPPTLLPPVGLGTDTSNLSSWACWDSRSGIIGVQLNKYKYNRFIWIQQHEF